MDCVVRHPVLSANLTSAGLDVLNALQNSVLSAYASHPGAVNVRNKPAYACWLTLFFVRCPQMVLCAPPGAGKTLSYVITAVMRHIAGYRDVAAPPGILILSPTRELAAQTEGVVQVCIPSLLFRLQSINCCCEDVDERTAALSDCPPRRRCACSSSGESCTLVYTLQVLISMSRISHPGSCIDFGPPT